MLLGYPLRTLEFVSPSLRLVRELAYQGSRLQEKVRVGALSVKKVRGDVNPADLFTKHLPSREKVHQLL